MAGSPDLADAIAYAFARMEDMKPDRVPSWWGVDMAAPGSDQTIVRLYDRHGREWVEVDPRAHDDVIEGEFRVVKP